MNSLPNSCCDAATNVDNILLTVVDQLDAMVAYWDHNKVCVFANNAYLHWFGKSRGEMIGITMQELLGSLYEKNLPYIQAAYDGQIQVFERDIPTPDGKTRPSLATYKPHIVDGRVCGIIVHVADVTPMKALELELRAAKTRAEDLATHDFLTGLPNRVLLIDRIEQAIASARRNRQMVAVICFDIDNFKMINDTHGHGIGDRLLIEVATRIKHTVREFDTVTRLGGDEFLVVAPEIEAVGQVEILAKRMLDGIKRPFDLGDTAVSSSLSLGIALYPRDGTTPTELMTRSDHALYAAKRHGKNRYRFVES